jgi:hypothetical protein
MDFLLLTFIFCEIRTKIITRARDLKKGEISLNKILNQPDTGNCWTTHVIEGLLKNCRCKFRVGLFPAVLSCPGVGSLYEESWIETGLCFFLANTTFL